MDQILADYPDDLKMTPGKMVYEVQPKLDWDKGKAVLYLLETPGPRRRRRAADVPGATITPTNTPSGRWKAEASASSSVTRTTPRRVREPLPPITS